MFLVEWLYYLPHLFIVEGFPLFFPGDRVIPSATTPNGPKPIGLATIDRIRQFLWHNWGLGMLAFCVQAAHVLFSTRGISVVPASPPEALFQPSSP